VCACFKRLLLYPAADSFAIVLVGFPKSFLQLLLLDWNHYPVDIVKYWKQDFHSGVMRQQTFQDVLLVPAVKKLCDQFLWIIIRSVDVVHMQQHPGWAMDWLRWWTDSSLRMYFSFRERARQFDRKTLYSTNLGMPSFW